MYRLTYRNKDQGRNQNKGDNDPIFIFCDPPVKGFDKVWSMVLERFVKESRLGNVSIEINDNNATPIVASMRLRQALAESARDVREEA